MASGVTVKTTRSVDGGGISHARRLPSGPATTTTRAGPALRSPLLELGTERQPALLGRRDLLLDARGRGAELGQRRVVPRPAASVTAWARRARSLSRRASAFSSSCRSRRRVLGVRARTGRGPVSLVATAAAARPPEAPERVRRSASQAAIPPGRRPASAAAVHHDHVGDRALEEGPVVADHHERARPVVEEVLERPQRVEVEVVGRLVEQEHVRLGGQGEEQLHPASLPTRQEADRRPLRVVVEPERLQQSRRRSSRAGGSGRRRPPGPAASGRASRPSGRRARAGPSNPGPHVPPSGGADR